MLGRLFVAAKERLAFKEVDSTVVEGLGGGVWERGSAGMEEKAKARQDLADP
jgi:hypothetical protein